MKITPAAVPIALAGAIIGFGLSAGAPEPSYIGAGQCRSCHRTSIQGRQHPIWEGSLHAKAFESLTTPAGLRIGRDMGVEKPAENPGCLECHAPLHERAPDVAAEGVTCEVCHGPGGDYAKANVMMNREKAVANGLTLYKAPGAIKTSCLRCHESAHGLSFDFEAAWELIRHPVPGR